ncbi:MAG: histidine kinase [Firmicutes bacterium]|nr:histidine kinase [Bacillota bacterium]
MEPHEVSPMKPCEASTRDPHAASPMEPAAGADRGWSPTRLLGIQWRMTGSYLLVGLVAVAAVAAPVLLAIAWGAEGRVLAWVTLAAAAGGVVGAGVQGFRAARRLKHRLQEVGRFAAALAAGNLGHRLQPASADEIGDLEEQLNEMADRLAEAMAALRELGEKNRALAYEAGALAERTRLARDLHDTVNQELFSLALLVAAARRRLEQGDVEGLGGELREAEAMARHAHSTIRALILQLRPPDLAQQGLAAALREYVASFAARHGLEATCRAEVPPLPAPVEEALFRMAQEALSNVAKHAQASTVAVELGMQDGQVRLVVRDNGRGFDPDAPLRPTALGLTGLRERAAALGGRALVRSRPGAGTEVTVQVPVPAEDGGERRGAGAPAGGPGAGAAPAPGEKPAPEAREGVSGAGAHPGADRR